jgi:YHS domain-containing protein
MHGAGSQLFVDTPCRKLGAKGASMYRRSSIWSTLSTLAVAVAACALLVTNARAGEFFERDGVALRGYDAVAYFKDGKPVKGTTEHKAEFKGSTFLFASEANRDAFAADPTRYAPQYGGYCAFGVSGGYKAAIDPAAFAVVDGKLYLNYNRKVQKQWSTDIPSFINKADTAWPAVMGQTKIHE